MVAENVTVRIIRFNFLFQLLSYFLFSINQVEFELIGYCIYAQQLIFDFTREQTQLKSTGRPIDSYGTFTSTRADRAVTTAHLNIPLTDHLVEPCKSSASLTHNRAILPVIDQLRDDEDLVDDDVDHKDSNKAPAYLVSVFLVEHTSSSLNEETDPSTEEDAVLVKQLEAVSMLILKRTYPAYVSQASQTGVKNSYDLEDSIVFKGKDSSNKEDSAQDQYEVEAQSGLGIGLEITSQDQLEGEGLDPLFDVIIIVAHY